MTKNGYAGYILEMDLTTGTTVRSPLSEAYVQRHYSGKSLAVQLLMEHTDGTEEALSEENSVVAAAAFFTGTGAPGSCRFDLASLSPKDDLPALSN